MVTVVKRNLIGTLVFCGWELLLLLELVRFTFSFKNDPLVAIMVPLFFDILPITGTFILPALTFVPHGSIDVAVGGALTSIASFWCKRYIKTTSVTFSGDRFGISIAILLVNLTLSIVFAVGNVAFFRTLYPLCKEEKEELEEGELAYCEPRRNWISSGCWLLIFICNAVLNGLWVTEWNVNLAFISLQIFILAISILVLPFDAAKLNKIWRVMSFAFPFVVSLGILADHSTYINKRITFCSLFLFSVGFALLEITPLQPYICPLQCEAAVKDLEALRSAPSTESA